MNIYDYTVPELNKFRELCNFTKDERSYFDLRAMKYTNYEIADEMNISDSLVSKLSRKCKAKMKRIV